MYHSHTNNAGVGEKIITDHVVVMPSQGNFGGQCNYKIEAGKKVAVSSLFVIPE
jgi:hypothetical protein